MKVKYLLLPLLLALMAWLVSCNAPQDSSYYEEKASQRTTYAKVSIGLQKNGSRQFRVVGKNAAVLAGLPNLTKTALIVAVPAGTVHDEDYTAVTDFYDRQLVNLTTSSVTLSLPMDTSLELFEYTFNNSYSLAELTASLKYVAAAATLGPFTISAGTSSVTLSASLFRALSASFREMIANGSYEISVRDDKGEKVYYYSQLSWNPLAETLYRFDRTTNAFVPDTGSDSTDDIEYELIDGTWTLVENGKGAPDSTFLKADYDNYVVYYTNPDFDATLTHIVDLVDLNVPLEVDGDVIDVTWSNPESKVYQIVATEPSDHPYRLEEPEENYNYNNNTTTQFATLEIFKAAKAYDSSSDTGPIACKEPDYNICLFLGSYVANSTSGSIYEVTYDQNYNPSSPVVAGTWQINIVQGKNLLMYTPDDTSYYYDGLYASFWAELNGLVWRGNYNALAGTGTETKFEFKVVNETAIADFTAFLQSAPEDFFVSDVDTNNSGPGIYAGPINGQGYTSEFDDSISDSASFQVRLNTQPSSNVTIDVTSDSPWEALVTSSTTLTFSSVNWDQEQTVTLAGVNDLVMDGHQMYSVILNASSSDPEYSSVSQNISVLNVDNDTVVVAGTTFNATQDFWTAMLLTDGTLHWDISFDGPASGFDSAQSVKVGDYNTIHVAGYQKDGSSDLWWIKTLYGDGTEDPSWDATFDGGFGDDQALAVAIDSSNDIYVAGTQNTGTSTDWWIKKFDISGNEDVSWDKTYDGPNSTNDVPYGMAVDASDNVYVAGQIFDATYSDDFFIRKYHSDASVDASWDIQFDGGPMGDDVARDVVVDSSGNVYVVGTLYNSTGLFDWWIKKFDSDANEDTTNWDKQIDGGSNGSDVAYSIAIDSAANIYVVGSRDSGPDVDWWIKKFAANGTEDTTNWNKVIGDTSTDVATKVLVDGNDHVWVFGYTHNGTDYDWRMIHFDSAGDVKLDVSSGGKSGDDMIYSADFFVQ